MGKFEDPPLRISRKATVTGSHDRITFGGRSTPRRVIAYWYRWSVEGC